MRKILILFVVIIIVLSSFACSPIKICGLNNFNINDSSTGLNLKLLPSDDFLFDYRYIEGDYCYFDEEDWIWGFEKTIIYLRYTQEEYIKAKKHCLSKFLLSDIHKYKYSGFEFYENTLNFSGTYPNQFNMFGFNDETCTLIFLGYYNGDPTDESVQLALTDFGTFLEGVLGSFNDLLIEQYIEEYIGG